MQAKVQPSVRQTTNLSPKALASTVVLQMSSQELEQYVDRIRTENPVIDFEPAPGADAELIKKLKWLSERGRRDVSRQNERYDDTEKAEPWAYVADKGAAFSESLTMQLCGLRLNRGSERTARYIIESLDDSGYFTEDVFESAELLHTTPGEFLNILGQLQASLEPAGLCAQSMEQCLVLQLERCGADELAQEIAAEHLTSVAKGDAAGLAKKLGVPKARVQRCFDLIRTLDPKPGRTVSSPPESEPYVVPDVLVEVIDGALNVSMFNQSPRILISEYYLDMLRMTQSQEVKTYLTDNIKQAKWLRYCIGQRDNTMLRVAKLIAERQKEFFISGPSGLRPMTLSEAADELGLHKSTVCRAINGKFIACSWGCFEMSRFFPRSLGQSAAELTSGELEERIKAIVAGEDKRHPYSDREIAERLSENGAGVSRRTVAKYRAAAGVPDTSVRRRRE